MDSSNKTIISRLVLVFHRRYSSIKMRLRTVYWSSMINASRELCVFGRVSILHPENLNLGSRVSLNEGVFINARVAIRIGNDVHISPGVIINSGQLVTDEINREHVEHPVSIGDGVWLASGAIINPGVTIGNHSIVCSGAVVTKDVPSGVMVGGVPARIIRNLKI